MAMVTKNRAMRKPKAPAQNRAEILAAATNEFAARGVDGARIDSIARQIRTTRAMIYYYFRTKENLYLAVLENAYRDIRESEKDLDLGHVPPLVALCRLVAFTLDYYRRNPKFIALVTAENQTGGRHIRKMSGMHNLNASAIDVLKDVLARGVDEGVFRKGIDPVDVHMTITSLGWFQIANRHTFGYLFDRDFSSRAQAARHRALITKVVLQFVGADSTASAKTRRSPRAGST